MPQNTRAGVQSNLEATQGPLPAPTLSKECIFPPIFIGLFVSVMKVACVFVVVVVENVGNAEK